jgi:hypothetical protein
MNTGVVVPLCACTAKNHIGLMICPVTIATKCPITFNDINVHINILVESFQFKGIYVLSFIGECMRFAFVAILYKGLGRVQ